MVRALIACLALLFAAGGDPPKKPKVEKDAATKPAVQQPALKPASIDSNGYSDAPAFDEQAEAQLLDLANRDRALAGLPALARDEGLTRAARNHALLMAQQRDLSHQFAGEPALGGRIAAASDMRLDLAGENVALDMDIESAQDHLMASPHHRRNLLDPGFDVAGFAVARFDGRLYVVQDFAHRLTAYTLHQSEALVAGALNQWRSERRLASLTATAPSDIRDAACGMAQTNSLKTRTILELARRQPVLSYTQSNPDRLPSEANRVLANPQLKRASIGVCFARTAANPSGAYWIAIGFE